MMASFSQNSSMAYATAKGITTMAPKTQRSSSVAHDSAFAWYVVRVGWL